MSKRKKSKVAAQAKTAGRLAPDSDVGEFAAESTLAMLRQELDQIDREILAAINRRGAVAQKIGHVEAG